MLPFEGGSRYLDYGDMHGAQSWAIGVHNEYFGACVGGYDEDNSNEQW